ncbi:MAG: hypothetical protein AAFO69_14645, partial [Bacteroidota bacterium]
MKKTLFILLISAVFSFPTMAQLDSAKVFVEAKVAVGTEGYLPQWIGYNQYGLLNPNENDGYLRGSATLPLLTKGRFSAEVGLDAVLKPQDFDNSFVNLAYGKLKYGAFTLQGGRYLMSENGFDHQLSSGNMFRSINTRPYWGGGFGIYQYTDLPFTDGYVQVKGNMEVGLLEDDRPTQDALYHEKSAYIKSNKLPINLIIGLNHNVLFGGTGPNGNELPGDFLEAFFA